MTNFLREAFDDGLAALEVLDAIRASARAGTWATVGR